MSPRATAGTERRFDPEGEIKTLNSLCACIVTQGTERGAVLVVEDETHLAELYSEYLDDNYDVRTAYGGVEAIEMLASDLDIVLLDRRMPIVSGNEVPAARSERSSAA